MNFTVLLRIWKNFWKSYFDLETDYGSFIRQIDEKDVYLTEAADLGQGIRILRQDLWEMIVSFLISQQNNIPRIRRCISNICERYGERRQGSRGRVYYTFPGPEALASASEEELRDCNLGYRSRYVKENSPDDPWMDRFPWRVYGSWIIPRQGKNCKNFTEWVRKWQTVSVSLLFIRWRLFL